MDLSVEGRLMRGVGGFPVKLGWGGLVGRYFYELKSNLTDSIALNTGI